MAPASAHGRRAFPPGHEKTSGPAREAEGSDAPSPAGHSLSARNAKHKWKPREVFWLADHPTRPGLPIPMHRDSDVCRAFRPRLQRRDRGGFAPPSLFPAPYSIVAGTVARLPRRVKRRCVQSEKHRGETCLAPAHDRRCGGEACLAPAHDRRCRGVACLTPAHDRRCRGVACLTPAHDRRCGGVACYAPTNARDRRRRPLPLTGPAAPLESQA